MSDTSVNFEVTRLENDKLLSDQIEKIRSAEDVGTLEPFARAYLGMFYEIDKQLPAYEKVKLLANEPLAEAILEGFVAALQREDIPSPAEIGSHMAQGKYYGLGYVVLAGIDRLVSEKQNALATLPPHILQAALCLHFSNTTQHQDSWADTLLDDKDIVVPALSAFWHALIESNSFLMPGLSQIIDVENRDSHAAVLVPQLLHEWHYVNSKTFKKLLFTAIQHVDADTLQQLARQHLDNELVKSDIKRVYWHALAFFLAPELRAQQLANFVGRLKQKVLPLLDFSMTLLNMDAPITRRITAVTVAQLLRIIAPVFPPQEHSYGSFGDLDVNSQNVMRLFHHLAVTDSEDVTDALRLLRKARVLKIYNGVIDYVGTLQKQKQAATVKAVPEFDEFIEYLKQHDKLSGRSNRFDLK